MITDIGREIIKLRQTGMTINKIKETLGCSKSTISKWCSTLKNNSDIIKENISNYGMNDENRKKKELELFRQIKPDDPSWFNDYKSRKREANKLFLMKPVGCKCQNCGYNKYYGSLAFHHIDDTDKEFNINGSKLTYSTEKLAKEASKCILLCHNCHSEAHAGIIDDKQFKKLCYGEIPKSILKWYANELGKT